MTIDTFGYVPQELDAGARRFRVRDHVPGVEPVRKMWKPGIGLLQRGRSCVGYGWTAELIAKPFPDDVSADLAGKYARNHWHRAQVHYYGANNYEANKDAGTSVSSAAKTSMERGLIGSYLWAQTIEEVRDAIITTGPVVIGIPWFRSMSDTPKSGRVVVKARNFDGARDGYHCVAITGYDPALDMDWPDAPGPHPAFRIRNSWGRFWGAPGGDGWIREQDMAVLFAFETEAYNGVWVDRACVPVGRKDVDLAALLAAHPDPLVS